MKIKEIRVKKGVTQLELAKKLGVSRSTVAMWEAGINTPNASKIPEISLRTKRKTRHKGGKRDAKDSNSCNV